MRKYIILIVSVIILLELTTLIIFCEQFVTYFKNGSMAFIQMQIPMNKIANYFEGIASREGNGVSFLDEVIKAKEHGKEMPQTGWRILQPPRRAAEPEKVRGEGHKEKIDARKQLSIMGLRKKRG